ncbi:MAG: hypothetical protein Q7W05_12950 [Deltaproteobacteria bacterium]|nr:hypothetical protein [Deltaproteobacteria bacterium]
MGTPNLVHEAARQIIENASDIHGALALAGRFDLLKGVIKIQKKAACIIQMERPEVSPLAGYRGDLMNGVATLGNVIERAIREMREDISDEDLLTVVRLAEVVVKRGHAYMEKVVLAESGHSLYLKNSTTGDDDDECA